MKNILIFLFYICTLTISGCSTNSPSPRQIPVIWTKDAATSIEIENAKTLVRILIYVNTDSGQYEHPAFPALGSVLF